MNVNSREMLAIRMIEVSAFQTFNFNQTDQSSIEISSKIIATR